MDSVMISTDYGLVSLKPICELVKELLRHHHPKEILIMTQEIRLAILDNYDHPHLTPRHLELLQASEEALAKLQPLDNPNHI